MSVQASRAKLLMATRDLSLHWHATRSYWRDAKSLEFERAHLDPLLPVVDAALGAIAELDRLLTKIRHDCE